MQHLITVLSLLMLITFAQSQTSPVPVEQEPHHRTLLKNDSVLVLRVNLAPGESTHYHTHVHDRAAIDLAANTIRQQKLGEQETPPAISKPGEVAAYTLDGPYTHRVENVGSSPMDLIDIEFLQRPKQPAGAAASDVAAENLSARAYRWVLAPGAVSVMHSHERPYLIVAATGMQLKMTAPDGSSFTHEVKPGDFHWIDSPVTHSLANLGSSPGEIVEFELK